MEQAQQQDVVEGAGRRADLAWREVRPVALAAAALAAAVWGVAELAGVEIVAASGQSVGLPSVVVVAVVSAYAGAGLWRVLARRTASPGRAWTWVALLVLLVSLTGPLGAASTPAAAVLVALHLVVAAVVVLGVRRSGARVAGRVA